MTSAISKWKWQIYVDEAYDNMVLRNSIKLLSVTDCRLRKRFEDYVNVFFFRVHSGVMGKKVEDS